MDKKTENQATKRKEKNKRKNKSLAFNAIAAVTIVGVVLIAVIFNIIVSNLVNTQIDLTVNKDFSMSEEAKAYLKTVNKEVEIVGLFDEIKKDLGNPGGGAQIRYYTDLYLQGHLNNMADLPHMSVESVMGMLSQIQQTNSKIKVSYVDPENDTRFVQNFVGADKAAGFSKGDFIVKCGDTVKRVTSAELCRTTTEMDNYGSTYYLPTAPNIDGGFLSAILYVTADERPVLGVVGNHNETKLENGYTQLQQAFENNAFEVKEVNLSVETDLSQYDILLMLDPKSDITLAESDALRSYLSKGGNLILAADSSAQGIPFVELNKVLNLFNLNLNHDLVKGAASQTTVYGLVLPVITPTSGPLTGVITNASSLIVPNARSVSFLSNTQNNTETNMLLRTDNKATTEDYAENKTTEEGVKCIAAVSSLNNSEGSKVLVLGSASLLNDSGLTSEIAHDTLMKISGWMEKSVNYRIPVKQIEAATITVPESSQTLIGWMAILLLPILLFAIGIFVWLKRRHL